MKRLTDRTDYAIGFAIGYLRASADVLPSGSPEWEKLVRALVALDEVRAGVRRG